MLTPAERRLLVVLALWLAAGTALELLALGHPDLLVPVLRPEGVREIGAAGRLDPADPLSRRHAPADLRQERAAPPAPRPLAYDDAGRLDLNRADSTELTLLDGVGPVLAGRILARRRELGRFGGRGDLLAVRGIGPRTLAKLWPQVTLGAAKDSLATVPARP